LFTNKQIATTKAFVKLGELSTRTGFLALVLTIVHAMVEILLPFIQTGVHIMKLLQRFAGKKVGRSAPAALGGVRHFCW
jgi:hypothetical protein